MSPDRLIARFLRCLAALQILTAVVAFLPRAWIASGHFWLGLGHMPDDVALHYIIRGAAYVQGAIGVLLWVIATDVVKYRSLVITTGAIYLFSTPPLYVIAALTGMPRYWCFLDSGTSFASGCILLALCHLAQRGSKPVPAS